MLCKCSDGWATTVVAKEKGLSWRIAVKSDAAAVSEFIKTGGSGRQTIDAFAEADLINHAAERYSNTHLLLDQAGRIMAFASNSMGTVKLTSQEMLGRNSEPVPEVPAMFLHRLGVATAYQRRGLGRLSVLRIFETLRHVCGHTAAFCVALYVDKENVEASALYLGLGFQTVETTKPTLKLMILGYAEAVEHVSQFERALRS